jgi:predicted metal-dependent hydrolase
MILDSIRFGSSDLQYEILRRGDSPSATITVTGHQVRVIVPTGTRSSKVREIVQSRGEWIITKLDANRRLGRSWPRSFVSGESLPYLGRQYALKVHRPSGTPKPAIKLHGGVFHLTIPADLPHAAFVRKGRSLVQQWYRTRLADHLHVPVNRLAQALRLPALPQMRVRNLQGRWGSYLPPDRIHFHWMLATQPPRIIEFVAAHELCHLRHPDHGRGFYRTLDRILPDWPHRDRALSTATLIHME